MAQYDINLREYWRILKKRKFIVIFTAIVLGVSSTFFSVLQAPPPLYSAICSIKFEKQTTIEGLYARTISWSGGDDIETQISLISSYAVLREVAQKLGLITHRDSADDGQSRSRAINIIDSLKSKIEVSREKYTNLLSIRVTDS
ncbi:MAG: Wzz/FepE/Etk N-terminal domain-containing protein, partial [Bacteroidota bacterium]